MIVDIFYHIIIHSQEGLFIRYIKMYCSYMSKNDLWREYDTQKINNKYEFLINIFLCDSDFLIRTD